MQRFLDALDRLMRAAIGAGQWLVLPVLLLLFAQWPLRDLFRAYSREANDLGQIFFAFYVAIALSAATRAGTHLAADALARSYPVHLRLLLVRLGALAGLLPWGAFILFSGRKIVLWSIAELELFPDTFNPGYFLIKCAMALLALLVIAQAILDIARPKIPGGHI
ncbi:MAG TPA: TRAP transporter small permease subunit [Xanthobacteraceae bacterium]|nr:TRAP transporter small permease subunit [Xanthobacteraceae bacterium]